MINRLLLLAIILFSAISIASDIEEQEQKIAREIYNEVKCIICQGQSINDSNTEIANDMKEVINIKLQEGFTKEEIFDYLASRYGDDILLTPKLNKNNFLLWFGPFIFLLFCVIIIGIKFSKKEGKNDR